MTDKIKLMVGANPDANRTVVFTVSTTGNNSSAGTDEYLIHSIGFEGKRFTFNTGDIDNFDKDESTLPVPVRIVGWYANGTDFIIRVDDPSVPAENEGMVYCALEQTNTDAIVQFPMQLLHIVARRDQIDLGKFIFEKRVARHPDTEKQIASLMDWVNNTKNVAKNPHFGATVPVGNFNVDEGAMLLFGYVGDPKGKKLMMAEFNHYQIDTDWEEDGIELVITYDNRADVRTDVLLPIAGYADVACSADDVVTVEYMTDFMTECACTDELSASDMIVHLAAVYAEQWLKDRIEREPCALGEAIEDFINSHTSTDNGRRYLQELFDKEHIDANNALS